MAMRMVLFTLVTMFITLGVIPPPLTADNDISLESLKPLSSSVNRVIPPASNADYDVDLEPLGPMSQNVNGVIPPTSTAYNDIDLESLQLMSMNVNGLLGSLVCVDPTSFQCQSFRSTGKVDDVILARYWLHVIDQAYIDGRNRMMIATWNYETNITTESVKTKEKTNLVANALLSDVSGQCAALDPEVLDYTEQRILKLLSKGGSFSSFEHGRIERSVENRMTKIFATGRVCRPIERKTEDVCYHLEPGLHDIMSRSRDYGELLWAWKGWRDAVGPSIGRLYPTYVRLINEQARNGGYADYGAELLSDYEDPNFVEEIDRLWDDIRPMYLQLHAYVRRKLAGIYGEDKVSLRSHIPAHVLGNMWAQQWGGIYDVVEPYPGHGTVDVTKEMKKQKWTVQRIFRTADKFFTSLGLEPMPDSFWTRSMLERPSGRQVECHGSAFDFYKDKDVRIKMCTEITMEDLYVAHHEMGHCQYFLQYRHQHAILRAGANPGFHEAVGDTVALSVNTPSYLHTIGLLHHNTVDNKLQINYLMRVALDKIAFLPFGLLIDKWRWMVFNGDIRPEEYNEKWWAMRRYYQGITNPIERGPGDFDPGAKYHVASTTPYIRYFVSHIIQFQFHKSLCDLAGNTGPLHLCNIYKSKRAGKKFATMLKIGRSRPWRDAMRVMTGQPRMDAGPITQYFQPLMRWLREENGKHAERIGWD